MKMDVNKILHLLNEIIEPDSSLLSVQDGNANLKDAGLDSLKFITFIVRLEEEFGIEVLDSDLVFENFKTVDTLLETLSKYFEVPDALKKCLILDCDGVLWKGISGEEAITFDNDVLTLQQSLLDLYNRGIFLCLCSKNESALIRESLSSSSMLLAEKQFAIIKVTREDKATSIKEITRELNISEDSCVFVDDSDYEIGFVSSCLPGITTIKADYPDLTFINAIQNAFCNTPSTGIDRTTQYREQKERVKQKMNFADVNAYNLSLETVVTCRDATKDDVQRISELSMRTNQFNLADTHFSEKEMEGLLNDRKYSIYVLSVSDKFGDMGIVGAAALHNQVIESFWLSCRAFDRDFEDILINKLLDKQENLRGIYRPNGKNHRFADFYRQHGIITQ